MAGHLTRFFFLLSLDDGIVVWMPWVYILRCSDKSLYVGHTDDLDSREKTHNEGRGSRYTAQRRPVHVVYFERHDSTENAIARERQVKRWTRSKKEVLITGNLATLKTLSRRRKKQGPKDEAGKKRL